MARRSRNRAFAVPDGQWFKSHFRMHVCCDCGLVHDVDWRIIDGEYEENWKRNEKETRKERRALKKRGTKNPLDE